MIPTLSLRNAQRHEKATFDFHEGVNAIVGPTDAGKSTVARSLRWVLFNKPANLNVMRRGAKRTEVAVVLSQKTILARVRTKTKNYYVLDGDEKKGFGKNVPDEIASVIDMDDTLHIQRQSDPYFMLALSSPTECARQLERYTDLSIITTSVQRARKSVFSIKSELRHVKEAIRPLADTVERLSGITALNDDILSLSKRHKEHTRSERRAEECKRYRDILLSLQSKLATLRECSRIDLKRIETALTALRTRRGLLESLKRCSARIQDAQARVKVDTVLSMKDTNKINDRIQYLLRSEEKSEYLKQLRSKMEGLQEEVEDAHKQVMEYDKQLKKVKRCPTCGQVIGETSNAKETICRGGRCPPNESEAHLPY